MIAQIWRFFPYLFKQFGIKGCQQSAAALTYMTLFAIVPMMTVTYAMFSVIPAFHGFGEQLQAMIFNHLVPSSGQELASYLKAFSDQARTLTLWGVGILVVTAYLMLKDIEKVFNTIWGVKDPRRGLSNFLLYWAVLSLGPILLGGGLAISTYLLSLQLLVAEFDPWGIVPLLLQLLPWVLTSSAFTLLFAAVPNCRVPLRDAFVCGVITALVFELLKFLFAVMVARSDMQVIYGAFAAVPLFLMWIYLLWVVVLGGAILVRSMSAYQTEVADRRYPDLVAALLALWLLREGQKTGVAMSDSYIVLRGLGEQQWQRLSRDLQQKHIITRTQAGGLVLSRDLHQLSLRELAATVGIDSQALRGGYDLQLLPWTATVVQRLMGIEEHLEAQFALTIGELFDSADTDAASESVAEPIAEPVVVSAAESAAPVVVQFIPATDDTATDFVSASDSSLDSDFEANRSSDPDAIDLDGSDIDASDIEGNDLEGNDNYYPEVGSNERRDDKE